MSIRLEIMFCFECKGATDHIVKYKAGEIISHRCRVCKHTHVCGNNHEV